MRARATLWSRYRDLPLAWKLTAPSAVLIVVAGFGGAALISRDLSARARATVNERLLESSLDVRAALQREELSLVESANLAANLQGMASAVERSDAEHARTLLGSVAALKPDLTTVTVARRDGDALAGLVRHEASGRPAPTVGGRWTSAPAARAALRARGTERVPGTVRIGDRSALLVAAPICSGTSVCDAVGVTVAGRWLDEIIAALPRQTGDGQRPDVALYDGDRALLAASGHDAAEIPTDLPQDESVRRNRELRGEPLATLFTPWRLGTGPSAWVAITMQTEPTVSSLRATGSRLFLLLLAVLAGIVLLGMFVSRLVVAQVRSLLGSSRSLGRGVLDARAPVFGDDELGELALRFNEMADQLQASHEHLERQVEQRTDEVRRLLRQRTEFFAAVSHELRTPLAIIINRAQMLLDASRPREKADREALNAIQDSARSLLGTVNDILDLARAESGTLDVSLSSVSIAKVVGEVADGLRGLAAARSVSLAADIPTNVPDVAADQRRLRDVLLNLVENAIKYTPEGGRVCVAAGTRKRRVEVTVTDTGIGIPPDVGQRVFEPFYRVPGVSPPHGDAASGLGLALAKRLVEAQGGRISFTSSPGNGTRFTIHLKTANRARVPRKTTATSRAGT